MNVVRQIESREEPAIAELTLDDFRTLHDSGAFDNRRKVELIEGVLFEVAAQKNRHAILKSELAFRLALALRELDSPLKAIVEPTVAMPPKGAPEPDIALSSETARDDYMALDTVALLIEISSTTLRFDLGPKARMYSFHGVREYWVIDLNQGKVHRHTEPSADGYRIRDEVALGGLLSSLTMPALAVDTAGLA